MNYKVQFPSKSNPKGIQEEIVSAKSMCDAESYIKRKYGSFLHIISIRIAEGGSTGGGSTGGGSTGGGSTGGGVNCDSLNKQMMLIKSQINELLQNNPNSQWVLAKVRELNNQLDRLRSAYAKMGCNKGGTGGVKPRPRRRMARAGRRFMGFDGHIPNDLD